MGHLIHTSAFGSFKSELNLIRNLTYNSSSVLKSPLNTVFTAVHIELIKPSSSTASAAAPGISEILSFPQLSRSVHNKTPLDRQSKCAKNRLENNPSQSTLVTTPVGTLTAVSISPFNMTWSFSDKPVNSQPQRNSTRLVLIDEHSQGVGSKVAVESQQNLKKKKSEIH